MERDRELPVTHDGSLPLQVPDIAALIGLGLVADYEAVIAGSWLPDV
jgi:hypothetical protein